MVIGTSFGRSMRNSSATAVYDGERDLFVRSPDGRGASACTIWFDPVNGVGLFEPVSYPSRFSRQRAGQSGDDGRIAPHEGRRYEAGGRWFRPDQCGRAGVIYVDGLWGFGLFYVSGQRVGIVVKERSFT